MSLDASWLVVALAILGTWRVAHALAHERGPFDAISRLHALAARLGPHAAEALACPYCTGTWIAMAPAAWLAPSWPAGLLLWLGIAGGAAALERALGPRG